MTRNGARPVLISLSTKLYGASFSNSSAVAKATGEVGNILSPILRSSQVLPVPANPVTMHSIPPSVTALRQMSSTRRSRALMGLKVTDVSFVVGRAALS